MTYFVVKSRLSLHGHPASYHVAAKDAADAIYEASKVHAKAVLNSNGLLLGFRKARAAQRAFLANVELVVRASAEAVAEGGSQ